MDVDGCLEFMCFENVACNDVAAPGVGAECGMCPSGYVGDGEKCDGVYRVCVCVCVCVCMTSWGTYIIIHKYRKISLINITLQICNMHLATFPTSTI